MARRPSSSSSLVVKKQRPALTTRSSSMPRSVVNLAGPHFVAKCSITPSSSRAGSLRSVAGCCGDLGQHRATREMMAWVRTCLATGAPQMAQCISILSVPLRAMSFEYGYVEVVVESSCRKNGRRRGLLDGICSAGSDAGERVQRPAFSCMFEALSPNRRPVAWGRPTVKATRSQPCHKTRDPLTYCVHCRFARSFWCWLSPRSRR